MTYCTSSMIIVGPSNKSFLNKSNSQIQAGAHIFLSEDFTFPSNNVPLLIIYLIIKIFMSPEEELELASLFITSKEMVTHPQTLTGLDWPQPRSTLQMDNLTTSGVTDNTIVAKRTKDVGIRFHWLRCQESQNKFFTIGLTEVPI